MSTIPRERTVDSSLALLREGYEFIGNRCRRYGSDAFETRLLLEPAVCMQGAEAARLVYGAQVTRKQALPLPIVTLLQDLGSVQMLDGRAHRHRKEMFLAVTRPGAYGRLVDEVEAGWRTVAARWREVVLLDAVNELLCRSACAWTGVPLAEGEAPRRAADFAAMVDGAGAVGPRNWRGHLARRRTERWVQGVVRDARAGRLALPDDSPAAVVASHRDPDGALLGDDVATVELINLLRPTVAVARYVVFCALALHEHPNAVPRDEEEIDRFVQEVRRFYPLFPAVAARVKEPFEWRGRHFPRRFWLLLDVYGTNRDARLWDEPGAFRPDRFRGWDGDPYTLVPQGAGDHREGHRCPGEWITIELMKVAVRALRGLRYDVPAQDLRVRLSRMPARPESGFVIRVGR